MDAVYLLIPAIILGFILTVVLLKRSKGSEEIPMVKEPPKTGTSLSAGVREPVQNRESVEVVYEGVNSRAVGRCPDCGCVYPAAYRICEICGTNLIQIK